MSDLKIVFLHNLSQIIVDTIVSYEPSGYETISIGVNSSEEEQKRAVADADFIILFGVSLSDEVIHAAVKTRLVQLLAAGYDRINTDLLSQLNIPCANNGGANSRAVAEHTVMLMLVLYKRLLALDRSTRDGNWRDLLDGRTTFEMAGKSVGILGMGNIGQRVATLLRGFEVEVQYYDKCLLTSNREKELNVRNVSVDELFQSSDVVSCHTALTSDTWHIVSRDRIAMMNRRSVLINTSRGSVVDERALINALSKNLIAGAALDVFEEEPVGENNPLLRMNNVVVTPHSAGTTWDTWSRRAEFAYNNIKRVSEGELPLAVIRDEI